MNIPHRCYDVTVGVSEIRPYTSPLFRRANEGTTATIHLPVLSHGPSYRGRGRTRPPAAATPDLVFLSILRVGGARQLASKDVQ
ncbi:MAG: hypothetical protein ABIU05_05290 [Nitrospirales bacterium]